MDSIFELLLISLLGSVLALVGGIVFLYNQSLAKLLEKNAIPFASGVLLAVSFFVLVPEVLDSIGSTGYIFIISSFIAVYLFEKVSVFLHHHSEIHHKHEHVPQTSSIIMVVLGDTIHNFIDGLTIGSTYLIAPQLGLISAISTFLHEFPHEIADFAILYKAKWKKSKILAVNFFSALATVLGALLAFYFITSTLQIGILLSICAGLFLYLGLVDFLPKINLHSSIPFLLGIFSILMASYLLPHS